MSDPESPRISPAPFLIADGLLVGGAAALVLLGHRPLEGLEVLAVAALCALGAGVMILPYLREHAAEVRLREQAGLAGTAQQIGELETLAQSIREATARWQDIHDGARRAADSATGSVEKVTAEARSFAEVLGRANDQEKQAMRLEIEKLRRGGTEHLQVLVHVLDHIHALYQAAARHGNNPVTTQLGQFRGACLDAVRRIGLVSYEARPGDPFDPSSHQTPEGKEPAEGSRVAATIACGYSYQGQPVRRILVTVGPTESGLPTSDRTASVVREASDDPALELPLDEGGPS
ncbi:MAG: hypothetical protein J0L84_08840 [Verrucomicrobia bacterium]|nr:hypothetical protein [Verrucomicrobiota bacterium]